MSPTSLANHPIAFLRTLSRRARSLLLLAFLFLIWRTHHTTQHKLAPKLSPQLNDRLPSAAGPTPSSKSLQFAPTQIKRTSAKVKYSQGASQDIHLPPKDRPDALQSLWRQDVAEVDVPLGSTVTLVGGELEEDIELEMGSTCAKGACRGAKQATLRHDLLKGLQQMREADASTPMVLEVPSTHDWPSDAVTLVTQFSISRLARFERTLREWHGPLSIAIYLTDEADIASLISYLTPSTLERWSKVAVTIVKPDYSISQEALTLRLRYPINRLRNLALSLAPTPYVVVTDADFVPSPHMHSILQTRGVPLIAHSPTSPASQSPTLHRTAIVISAFALTSSFPSGSPYPSTPSELSSALSSTPPHATLTDPNAGHGPSSPSLLFSLSPLPLHSHASPTDPSWSFPICYEPQWEPYYLLHRASHPLYDERFTDQGGDKQSHALLLNALGYEFKALRGVWFMHPPKGGSGGGKAEGGSAGDQEDDDIDEAWPSARLVDPELEERGEEEDHDPTHFNARAQRDERRFRYFQDFLPEMEKVWGGNLRWPRGCGAGEVASGRSFGRARLGSVFGV
ncbi:hypothetical protein BCR35DRAFT_334500 [Leucosporidium creatinivorum]|uniref:Glycosyl-transferase for dystroglycan-domain-containing protein n=1 Tax=Leucosporidium creatinivorum TaxID=106004 RepID=A0A1Y2E5U9_9BASI|nr:hypothetical protein BCR35DRAFT_334500 [Leucosporidium creatinivorum]